MNWAIINGEKTSGLTTFYLDKGMDTGDIIFKEEIHIPKNINVGHYHDILAEKGKKLVLKTLKAIEKGSAPRIKQEEGEATYAPKFSKQDGLIDWTWDANKIHNLVRGLTPFPGCYTFYQKKQFNILETKVLDENSKYEPGIVTEICSDYFNIQTGEGQLSVYKVKPQNKTVMLTKAYLNGAKILVGDKMGD